MPVRCSRPSTALVIKQTEKHPRRSIYYTRKVCVRAQSTLAAHNGVVYDTPRGVTPAFVFELPFDCGSFEQPKTKRQ